MEFAWPVKHSSRYFSGIEHLTLESRRAICPPTHRRRFWRDDGQVCSGFVSKVWAIRPGTTIAVTSILEEPAP
jgi:hypothetical protein